MNLIITSCTAKKDDSIPLSIDIKPNNPTSFLSNDLAERLVAIREEISKDPRAQIGNKLTLAFDMYVRTGKAYKEIFLYQYDYIRNLLLSRKDVEWLFLSGLYGIIHSLELARKYQATFNKAIASKRNIPYTGKRWENLLPIACDYIFSRFKPDNVFILGSSDYTQFVKCTDYWRKSEKIMIIESTGSNGPLWLAPILSDLIASISSNQVFQFKLKYGKYTKQ